jgi:hypothetical protein
MNQPRDEPTPTNTHSWFKMRRNKCMRLTCNMVRGWTLFAVVDLAILIPVIRRSIIALQYFTPPWNDIFFHRSFGESTLTPSSVHILPSFDKRPNSKHTWSLPSAWQCTSSLRIQYTVDIHSHVCTMIHQRFSMQWVAVVVSVTFDQTQPKVQIDQSRWRNTYRMNPLISLVVSQTEGLFWTIYSNESLHHVPVCMVPTSLSLCNTQCPLMKCPFTYWDYWKLLKQVTYFLLFSLHSFS